MGSIGLSRVCPPRAPRRFPLRRVEAGKDEGPPERHHAAVLSPPVRRESSTCRAITAHADSHKNRDLGGPSVDPRLDDRAVEDHPDDVLSDEAARAPRVPARLH